MSEPLVHPVNSEDDLYQLACRYLPGGISRNAIFRRPHPSYVSTASGCRVTDMSGVTRLDFANNVASLILGHAHPAIVEAVSEQVKRGTAFTMGTEAEVRLAEHLCQRVNSFDKIRFCNSGTEAVMNLIKVSHAFTGRPMYAKAEGAYHGSYDFAEVSQTSCPDDWGDIDRPNSVAHVMGTPQGVLDNVVIFPFNDVKRTLAILDRYADRIACVLIDPLPHRIGMVPASQEFVHALRDWTERNGALLAFDEVICFRTHFGGAQQSYDVKPDLTSLGKIIGGGFPVGALAGNRMIMDILDQRNRPLRHPLSGTFSANPMSMTAGLTAMRLFNETAVEELNALTETAKKQIREAARTADIPVQVCGAGSLFRIHFRHQAPVSYRDSWQNSQELQTVASFLDHMYEEGIMMINTASCALNLAMGQAEIDMLSEACLSAFRKIRPLVLDRRRS